MLEQVFRDADRFDILHFHCDSLHFPFSRREWHPHITTLHGRLDLPSLARLYHEYEDMPLVSISDAQRRPLPWASWQGTVYHGLPETAFTFHEQADDYLLFLGRISPEKRVDRAVEIARRAGRRLKIAAKVDTADQEYFEQVKPLLDEPFVEFLGEVGGKAKEELLGNAYAFLFPIHWPEPFGLVMIESMACGTPVIAWRNGSVPEVMVDGVTGFVVDSVEEAVQALDRVATLSRSACRRTFEQRFTATRMAQDYVEIYKRMVQRQAGRPVRTPHHGTTSMTGTGRAGTTPIPRILAAPAKSLGKGNGRAAPGEKTQPLGTGS
jgi:glycosyltransferase involved in cell wall biosynthesis